MLCCYPLLYPAVLFLLVPEVVVLTADDSAFAPILLGHLAT